MNHMEKRITKLEQAHTAIQSVPVHDDLCAAHGIVARHNRLRFWQHLRDFGLPYQEPTYSDDESAFLKSCDDGDLSRAEDIVRRYQKAHGYPDIALTTEQRQAGLEALTRYAAKH